MLVIKRQVLLNYKGENHIYYKMARSDAQALLLAQFTLEEELGLVRGALKHYFINKPGSWEVHII